MILLEKISNISQGKRSLYAPKNMKTAYNQGAANTAYYSDNKTIP